MSNVKHTSLEAELAQNGMLVYANVGVSMRPLLRQGKDLMVIRKKLPQERCKKYGAVLFKRANGQYVLHRVLQVRAQDYVICGDNCIGREYGITDEQILGVMTQVVRGGRKQRVIKDTDFLYRCYVHLWCDFYPVRALLLRCRLRWTAVSVCCPAAGLVQRSAEPRCMDACDRRRSGQRCPFP